MLRAAEHDSKEIAGYLALAAGQNNAPKGMITVAEGEEASVFLGLQRAGIEADKLAKEIEAK